MVATAIPMVLIRVLEMSWSNKAVMLGASGSINWGSMIISYFCPIDKS